MRVPTRRRLRRATGGSPRRPRNLSVPGAGQAKRRARSLGGNVPLVAIPGRIESGPGRGRRRSARIGSVRYLLGTWAASARLLRRRKPQTSARRPIQADEVEHPAHVSLCGIHVPDSGSLVALAPCASVRPNSSPRRAEVGSTAVEHRGLHSLVSTARAWDAAFRWAGRTPAGPPRPSTAADVNGRRTACRQRAAACGIGGRRYGRSSPPVPTAPSSCRVCAPGGPAISWRRAKRGASGTPPR